MPNPITDVLWWINSEVAKLSGLSGVRVVDVLKQAQAELTHDLTKAITQGKDDRYTAQVHRNALMQIQGSLDYIKQNVKPEFEELLQGNATQGAMLATSHLVQEVQRFSSIFEGTVRPVAFDAMRVIAEGKKTLYPQYRTSAARYAGAIGNDIRRQLAIGVVKGETIDQLTTRLAKMGGPKGLVYLRGKEGDPGARAEMIAEGLFKRYRYWGERIARTEVVSAYNHVALDGMDELEAHDPGYFKRWDAAIDGRTCIICRQYDDLVVPLNGKFPLGYDKPPRHPNCRCAVVIWRKEWNEVDVRDNIAAEVTKGKPVGSVASVPHKVELPRQRRARRSAQEMEALRVEQERERSERILAREARARASAEGRQSRAVERERVRMADRTARQQARAQAERQQREEMDQAQRHLDRLRNDARKYGTPFDLQIEANRIASRQGSRLTAERILRVDARLQREIRQEQVREARQARLQARQAKDAQKQRARDLRAQAKTFQGDDKTNLQAVARMRSQPMASTVHERIDASGVSAHQKEEWLKGFQAKTGVPVTFEEATHAWAPPPGYTGKVRHLSGGLIRIDYHETATGKPVAELTRSLRDGKDIHHDYFVLKPGFQGGGFSDTLNGQAVLRYEKWGLKSVSVDAAWVGRYAWARMGFSFEEGYELNNVLRSGQHYIRKNVAPALQAEYMAKLDKLVHEPWKLAKWDEGIKYPASFKSADGDIQRGDHPIGKAILLQDGMPMWSGNIKLDASNGGYLNAMRLLNVAGRK